MHMQSHVCAAAAVRQSIILQQFTAANTNIHELRIFHSIFVFFVDHQRVYVTSAKFAFNINEMDSSAGDICTHVGGLGCP